ncbi:YybH family protein [Microbacterium sp. MAHUQ-60]|uniref:YybH family protein n=1 Tax=unclassified Microbacterium TaxID=2609290 RepID=UPI0036064B9A
MSIQDSVIADPAARTIARSEITALLQRYANMAVENADFAGMSRLFSEDGSFILLDGTAVPVTEIEQIVAGNESTFIRHHLTTIHIEFTSETTANADSYYIAFTDLAQPDHWGRWLDTLRREPDGRWVLVSKQPVVEGYHPEGWVATILFPAMQAQA